MLPSASKYMSLILIFPQVLSVINSDEAPTFMYFVMVSMSIYVLYMYMRRIENGVSKSNIHTLAAVSMPIVSGIAICTYVGLLMANLEKSEDVEQPLGSSLGIVHQYRLNDVINTFREIVTNRQEDLNVSEL